MKYLKYTIIFHFLFLVILTSYSQDRTEIKDMLQRLEVEKDDISRLQDYQDLSRSYISLNLDSSLMFANKGLYLATQIDYLKGKADFYATLGDIMVVSNELYLAKEHYLKALAHYVEAENLERQANVLLVLGNIGFVQDNYIEALDFYVKGKNIADSLKLVKLQPDFYNNIGNIYFRLDDVDASLEYFNIAQELFEQTGKHDQIPIVLSNMISIHLSLNEFEEATALANRIIHLADSIPGIEYLKLVGITQLGNIEFNKGNYVEALKYYEESFDGNVDIGKGYKGPKSVEIANSYLHVGKCHLKLNNITKAEENLLKAYAIAEETGQLGVLKDVTELLAAVYEKADKPKVALKFYKIFKEATDSIINDQTFKKITQVRLQYEFAEKLKEQELEQTRKEAAQKRKEIWLYVIIGGFFIGLVFLGLLYLLQKNKSKRTELQRKNLKLNLESKNKELTTNVMYLMKKNEFLLNISDKLKKSRYNYKPANRLIVDDIIQEIENSSKEVSWKEFELRFQDVYSSFYKKLNAQFPNLSPNEQKLCAFLKLNMSTKDISAITYQSYNSIMIARHRLRKKMDIDTNENLISFLNQL